LVLGAARGFGSAARGAMRPEEPNSHKRAMMNLGQLVERQMQAAKTVLETGELIKECLAAEGIHINVPQSAPRQAAPFTVAPSETSDNAALAGLSEPLLAMAKKNEGDLGRTTSGGAISSQHSGRNVGVGNDNAMGGAIMEAVFPDRNTIKDMLKGKEYAVEDLYSTTGPAQALARNSNFQMFMFAVICSNAIWIGIGTDYNKADVLSDAPWWIQVGENIFCTIFAFEVMVRFLAFERKRDAWKDGWFCFDFSLVLLMVWETWVEVAIVAMIGKNSIDEGNTSTAMILRIFRVSRLTRISRLGRISRFLREVPELAILSKAMIYALRSVGATLLLLVVSIYVFAIFFVQMFSGTGFLDGEFETVLIGMHTLLVQGILADQADLINGMLDVSFWYYVVILMYMLVAALTVANMLIGVICDLIGKVSDEKREDLFREKMETTMGAVLKRLDVDGTRTISKTEFNQMVSNEDAALLLDEARVDIASLVGYADLIFEEKEELGMQEFMEVIMGFRDEDHSMKDQLEMKSFLKKQLLDFENRMKA